MDRDLDKRPYSTDEARVAAWFAARGLGGGDDPIGSLLASHEYAVFERNEAKKTLAEFRDHVCRTATKWKDGGGSHHDPIWAKVAEAAAPY